MRKNLAIGILPMFLIACGGGSSGGQTLPTAESAGEMAHVVSKIAWT